MRTAVRERKGPERKGVIHVGPGAQPPNPEVQNDGQWGPFQVKSGRQGNMERGAPGV